MASHFLVADGATLGADHAAAEWVSRVLGWSYVTLWAVSFVPQIIHSQRTRNVSGVSSDFIFLNVTGFLSYLSALLAMLANATVRREYEEWHHGFAPLTRWNDAAFAAWASLCALTQLGQAVTFHRTANPVSHPTKLLLAVIASSVGGGLLATATSGERWWTWLDYVNFLFFVKLAITLVKYAPQVTLNYRRKSTIGYRVENLFADLGGGLLSLAQLVLDASIQGDWSGITGHPAKLYVNPCLPLLVIIEN